MDKRLGDLVAEWRSLADEREAVTAGSDVAMAGNACAAVFRACADQLEAEIADGERGQ